VSGVPDEDDTLAHLRELLELERRETVTRSRRAATEDNDDERQARGELLTDLIPAGEEGGFDGRVVLAFRRRGAEELPPAGFPTGSVVEIEPPAGEAGRAPRGVVALREHDRLEIVLDHDPPAWVSEGPQRMVALPDDVTWKRMADAVARARDARGDRLAHLRELFRGRRTPDRPLPQAPDLPGHVTDRLDPTQQDAVRRALAAPEVFLVHGPPGTGKTTTCVALIQAAVASGQRVLACAPSNAATDLLAERLGAVGVQVVRLGHPARMTEAVRDRTLEAQCRADPESKVVRRLSREAQALRARIAGGRTWIPREEFRAMKRELRSLRRDARRIADQLAERVLSRAQVVCCTLAGAADTRLQDRSFDMLLIDEAAQALEPACWIALPHAPRVVLAGDHHQLPPTVLSDEAARRGLARTLFERVHASLGAGHAAMLGVQYRMHQEIAAFSNEQFYAGRLTAAPSVREHRLTDLPGFSMVADWLQRPFLAVDTAGAGWDEERPAGSSSTRNPGEAVAAARIARSLLDSGAEPGQVGVITPYAAQVALLREHLAGEVTRGLEVGTADGFQGREREAIIVSLVRSNPAGRLGFLRDVRRMNVAMTRARRLLVVLLDSATMAAHPFYEALLDHAERTDALTSVWEHGLVD
jgi:superfamily I DNA and/or RNA helicase